MKSGILYFLLILCLGVRAQEKKALLFSGLAAKNTIDKSELRNDVSILVAALTTQGFKKENITIDSNSTDKTALLSSLSTITQYSRKGDFILLYFYQPVVITQPGNETALVLNNTGQQTVSFKELTTAVSSAAGMINDPAAFFYIFNSDLSAINTTTAKNSFTSDVGGINGLFACHPGESNIYTSSASLFTRAFSDAITLGSSYISTYQDLLQRVENMIILHTTKQRPVLYTTGVKQSLFNNRFTKSPVYFTVRSQPANERVVINAGQNLNILQGTPINFYPANSIDTARKLVTRGIVTASDELTATVTLSKPFAGADQLWAFAGWNERENVPITALTFNTNFSQTSNPEKRKYYDAIVKGIKDNGRLQQYVKFVSSGGDLQISDIGMMSKDSVSCTIANPRTGRPLKDFYYSTKSKDIIYNTSGADKYSEVEEWLVNSAEWQYLSKLHNDVRELQADISFKGAGNAAIQHENGYPVVYENDDLRMVLHNPHSKKIYFAVIALRTDKSIKLLYPGLGEESSAYQVLPGQDYISEPISIPAIFGLEKLKIITSTNPVDIEELRQKNILTRKKENGSSFLPEYTNIQDLDYEIRSRVYAPEPSGKKIHLLPVITNRNMSIKNNSAEKIFFNVLQSTGDGNYTVLFPNKNKPAADCAVEPSITASFNFETPVENNTQLITVYADRPFLLTELPAETRSLNEVLVEIIRSGRVPGSPLNKMTLTQQLYSEKTTAATRGTAIVIKLINPKITPDKGLEQQALTEEYSINGFALTEENGAVKTVKINGSEVEYDKALKFFDKTLQLVPGNNKIVIAATDEKGFTETRILDVVLKKDNTDATAKGNNYFLGIGIDKYEVWPPLSNAKNDVDSLANMLQSKFGYLPGNIKMLTDSQATRKNIIKQLRSFLVTAKPNDNIIVYFSGHGNKDQLADGDYYFIPSDGEADDVSSAVKSTDIIDNFKNIKAKHCLLIMDACFSGLISNSVNKQQISVGNANKNLADLPSKWIITSGRATKVSDGPPGTNSPFASVMLSYLRDNNDESKLTVSKLIDYLKDNVPKFNKQQIPFGTSIAGEGELVFRIIH